MSKIVESLLGFVRSMSEPSKAPLFGSQEITTHVKDAAFRARKAGVPLENTDLPMLGMGRKADGSDLRKAIAEIALAAERHPYCPCCGRAYVRNRSGLDSGANGKGGPRGHSPTVHRVVPHLGYVRGNMIFICYACNMAIGDIGGDIQDVTVRIRAISWQLQEIGDEKFAGILSAILATMPQIAKPE